MRTRLFLSLITLLLVLAACVRPSANTPDGETGSAVPAGRDKLELEAGNGKVVIGRRGLPRGFPRDLPLYPRSRIRTSVASQEAGKKSLLVILDSRGSVARIAAFYEAKLVAKDWRITNKISHEGSTALISAEKPGFAVSVSLGRDAAANKTNISLSVSNQ